MANAQAKNSFVYILVSSGTEADIFKFSKNSFIFKLSLLISDLFAPNVRMDTLVR